MVSPNSAIPSRIEKQSEFEMLIEWNNGEKFSVPFTEIRFLCPCAGCVNEHTGQRMIQRSHVQPGIRPTAVELVGRYAVQITWTDRHSSGIYPFNRLYDLCRGSGMKLA